MEQQKCPDFLRQYFPFWDKLTDTERQKLCQAAKPARFDKGAHIHGGDGSCTGVLIVEKGCLRVYLMSDEGREITLYRLYAGEVCILSASCAMRQVTFDVFVDAEEESMVQIVNGSAFAEVTASNIYAENFALRSAAESFSSAMWVMQQILFMSFDKRLAIFLLDEAAKTGSDTLHLTHDQIARYMGSAREVVSRMLRYFTSEGLVRVSRGTVEILDKKGLRKRTE